MNRYYEELEATSLEVPAEAVAMADEDGTFAGGGNSPDPAANRAEYERLCRWWELKRRWCLATGHSEESWRAAVAAARRARV